jgi:N-acetylglucosaminyldiphosphoundecaprenol N-acetyl-beta-D-mannosaminyltransferase
MTLETLNPVSEPRSARIDTRSYSLMGARIDAMTDAQVVRLIAETIEAGDSRVIANHNMHSLYVWQRDPRMREFFSIADYSFIDGMLVVLLGQLAGLPLKREQRARYLDFVYPLFAEAARRRWRTFFLGSEPGVAEKAADELRQLYPGLQMRTRHGHFDAHKSSEENRAVLREIDAYSPHLLLVGMGMPRQEVWILENRNEICANVIAPCGAILDYIAGVKRTPPSWLGPLYLEWTYRLLTEPARLSRRYLVEPWFVLWYMARRFLKNGRAAVAAEINRSE